MVALRRALWVSQRLRLYPFTALNCRELWFQRTMEKVKIAFDLAHLLTRTLWPWERKRKLKLLALLPSRSP